MGLKLEDIEVFKEHLISYFKDMSMDLGIVPNCICIQTSSDDSEIAKLKSQELCDSCRKEYSVAKGRAWPCFYLLYSSSSPGNSFNTLSEHRSDLEKELRKLAGTAIYVPELGLFTLRCGCAGLAAATMGLRVGDINSHRDRLFSYFKRLSIDLGVDPKVMYVERAYGTTEVTSVISKHPCEGCQARYGEEQEIDSYIKR
jgi:hypothetical protein